MRQVEVATFPDAITHARTDGHIMEGYASAFDYPIPSGDQLTTFMRPKVFTKSIAERAEHVQVLFNHGKDPRYGQLPIGVPTRMEPDRVGLWTETNLHAGPDNANIVAALQSRALRSMSVAFIPMQMSWNDDHTERYVEQAQLLEYGPVTFPANEGATARLQSVEQFAMDLLRIELAWDGAAALASCDTAGEFRQIAFERSNDSDPATAAHWALPHHPSPGADADPQGVAAAIAALHGGRGGAPDLVLPLATVERHLQAHQAEASSPDRGEVAASVDLDRLTRRTAAHQRSMDVMARRLAALGKG